MLDQLIPGQSIPGAGRSVAPPEQNLKAPMQRALGSARAGFVLRDGRTTLMDLHQSGCAKCMLPSVGAAGRAAGGSAVPEVVFLNTAGGLTGGDRLDYALTLEPGCRATATTQTAERAYASAGGVADVRVSMQAGAGAVLDWLPQETILFNASAMERKTEIHLQGDARLLFCETLVLGRAAMCETVETLWLRDRRSVWRDGAPVMVDPVALDSELLSGRDNPALLGGAQAIGMLALVAPGAEDALGALRSVLPAIPGVRLAASGWDGRLVARLMASDAWPLRKALAILIHHFRDAGLPRVWQI